MKKLLNLLMVFLFVSAMVACGGEAAETEAPEVADDAIEAVDSAAQDAVEDAVEAVDSVAEEVEEAVEGDEH